MKLLIFEDHPLLIPILGEKPKAEEVGLLSPVKTRFLSGYQKQPGSRHFSSVLQDYQRRDHDRGKGGVPKVGNPESYEISAVLVGKATLGVE